MYESHFLKETVSCAENCWYHHVHQSQNSMKLSKSSVLHITWGFWLWNPTRCHFYSSDNIVLGKWEPVVIRSTFLGIAVVPEVSACCCGYKASHCLCSAASAGAVAWGLVKSRTDTEIRVTWKMWCNLSSYIPAEIQVWVTPVGWMRGDLCCSAPKPSGRGEGWSCRSPGHQCSGFGPETGFKGTLWDTEENASSETLRDACQNLKSTVLGGVKIFFSFYFKGTVI